MNGQYEFFQYGPRSGHWYEPSPALCLAVNTALAAEQALLVTGEPGTGKTTLARSIAEILGLGEVLTFNTHSDHQARDCLYTFDSLARFYDAQVGHARAKHPETYVRWEALGEAVVSRARRVVLIDEIDKAPRDFPNDLLHVVENLSFVVRETGESYRVAADARPILVLTSNGEKPLPDPFLRRCIFHHIEFPDTAALHAIVEAQLRTLGTGTAPVSDALVAAAIARFEAVRRMDDLEKKPATAELLVWLRVLVRAGVDAKKVADGPLADLLPGALAKTGPDLERVKRG